MSESLGPKYDGRYLVPFHLRDACDECPCRDPMEQTRECYEAGGCRCHPENAILLPKEDGC